MNPKYKTANSQAMRKISKLNDRTMSQHQQGLVLVTSLIFLLLMTLIGITSIRTATLEERMAGNTRDQQLSFMATETALREAEAALELFASTSIFGNGTSNGYYDLTNDADYTASATWTGTNSIVATAMPEVSSAPRYYIKLVTCIDSASGGSLGMSGYGKVAHSGDTQMFRITARGTGGTDTSSTALRSHYGKVMGSC